MNKYAIFIAGILLIATHNLLDNVHVQGNGIASFLWASLHQPGYFTLGNFTFSVRYPLLPWIGVMAVGYVAGSLFIPTFNTKKRKKILLLLGGGAIMLFLIFRAANFYGDAAQWSLQKNALFTLLSFLNVTKYPPSLLYILMTMGPALICLSLFEKPLNKLTSKVTVFGRVPMFYYLIHLFLIHAFAIIGAIISGYKWQDMILSTRVNASPQLNGYGFYLITVYIIWIGLVIILYPFCKWFDEYKRCHQAMKWWLSYL